MQQQLHTVLNHEATVIQAQIDELQQELDLIARLRTRHTSGFTLHRGGAARAQKTTPAPRKGASVGASKKGKGLSTMDMARQVLDNNGGKRGAELSFPEIRAAIKETFGVDPASSLNQMLYKRAKAGTGFYRTQGGKYGRLEWKSKEKAAA